MSQSQLVRDLEALEEISIRGHLSIEDLVRRQIERCNMTMGGLDPSLFEANVRALLTMLPSHKRKQVLEKESDFNKDASHWQYQTVCGIQCGTPENPITSDGEPPNENRTNVISPVWVEDEQTDYEKLYELILTAFESVGLTWNIEQKTVEMGKVIKEIKVPPSTVKKAVQAVTQILLDLRDQNRKDRRKNKALPDYSFLTFDDIIQELREEVPPTPVFTDPLEELEEIEQ